MYLLIENGSSLVQQPLPGERGVIGSAADCAVFVAGAAPRHARYELRDGALTLEGLDASLSVEGQELARHTLRPGVEVSLGGAKLWLVREPDEVEVTFAKAAPVALPRGKTTGPPLRRSVTNEVARVAFGQATLGEVAAAHAPATPAEAQVAGGAGERHAAERLAVLTEMARSVGSAPDAQRVYAQLLELLERALAPEHAALVLRDDAGALRILAASNAPTKSGKRARPLQLSGTLVARVIERGEALLVTDATQDEQTRGVRSIARQRIRAVACVPYYERGVVSGAVYVDTRSAGGKAFDEADLDLLIALSHLAAAAAESAHTTQTLAQLEREVAELRGARGGSDIVGEAQATELLRTLLGKVARSELPVLIVGERGTGKELAASSIHRESERAQGPFVAVNCAAIPETLTESAFFGHVRGAFTGAERDQAGYFRQADGGTLFLDEVGDLRLGAQAALLRALQQSEVLPVGAAQPIRVDVRVVCATNRKLQDAAKTGVFRHDLLDRLEVLRIDLPPLRERAEDVPLLATHFAQARGARVGARALELLRSYPWPGNIRELKNVVERALVLGDGQTIWPEDLPPALREKNVSREHLGSLESVERDHICRVLRHTGGNIAQAAAILGVQRLTVYKKLEKYQLDAADFKGE